MDNMLYNALEKYYYILEAQGLITSTESFKLLILSFYRDFVYNDFRGLITKEDYHFIEKALDCLYGTSCLIPYPDYLKMGKLHLGEMTELVQRIKNLEDTDVVKMIHSEDGISDGESDVIIVTNDEE